MDPSSVMVAHKGARRIRKEETDSRRNKKQDAEQLTNVTDKSPSRYRNHVVATSEEHHQEHHEHGTSERCIEWLLVRQEQDVVRASCVEVKPAVQKRIQVKKEKDQSGKHNAGKENLRNKKASHVNAYAWKKAQRSFNPSQIPIRLGVAENGRGSGGAVDPDWVDLNESAHERNYSKNDEAEAEGFQRIGRPQARSHNRLIRTTGARIVRVLLSPDNRQMDGDEDGNQRRN